MFFRLISSLIVLVLLMCVRANGKTVKSVALPEGYERKVYPEEAFSGWVQSLKLKENKTVRNYRGEAVGGHDVLGVVDMPLMFRKDWEQCADFAMRFWAEYHKDNDKLDSLYLFTYDGTKNCFNTGEKSYKQFLKNAFVNTNSFSLKRGCREIKPDELKPGDLFVQNERGGVGHVTVVVDVCENENGEKLFLIGYSYMPAQEFHIEKGWFAFQEITGFLNTRFRSYGEPVLRRF